jgi:DNA polymerase-3 subunit delta
MADHAPVVYLLHGEDEFAIAQFVAEIEAKLGDDAMAQMNTTRLDGRSYDPAELGAVANVMPFLAKRRLVVFENPLTRLNSSSARQNFQEQLENIPSTTAMVLVEYRLLTSEKDRRQGRLHWLERWAQEHADSVYLRAFPLPKGTAMVQRIQEIAKAQDGQITPAAAALLATLVDDDPRLADQEIRKLLAYVNYQRAIEPDDVDAITADYGQGDIFEMVDALGNQDGKRAIGMLHRLLESQDPFSIFGMIVRQFRLLLLTREILDNGGQPRDAVRTLKLHPYVADKMSNQARHFTLPVLERIYHRLLAIDEAMKTSQMSADLALDTMVAALTGQASPRSIPH